MSAPLFTEESLVPWAISPVTRAPAAQVRVLGVGVAAIGAASLLIAPWTTALYTALTLPVVALGATGFAALALHASLWAADRPAPWSRTVDHVLAAGLVGVTVTLACAPVVAIAWALTPASPEPYLASMGVLIAGWIAVTSGFVCGAVALGRRVGLAGLPALFAYAAAVAQLLWLLQPFHIVNGQYALLLDRGGNGLASAPYVAERAEYAVSEASDYLPWEAP